MNIIFMEDQAQYRTSTVMLLKARAEAAGLQPLTIEAPDFSGADEGMEKLVEAISILPPDVFILDNNWSSSGLTPDGVEAAKYLIEAYKQSAEVGDTMPILAVWSANSLKPEEMALFDRVLTQKGQTENGKSTAVPEILAFLKDVQDGAIVSKHMPVTKPVDARTRAFVDKKIA